MNFRDVQEALRNTGRDGLLAYDSAADPLVGLANTHCRGSWNVYRDGRTILVGRGEYPRPGVRQSTDRSPLRDFDDPAAAHSFLLSRAREDCPAHSIRSLTSADLPATLREWLLGSGWQLERDLFGNPLVAQRRDQSWRLLATAAGLELRGFDHRVPANVPGVTADRPEPLFGYLLVMIGPPPGLRPLGWPRLGLPLPPGPRTVPEPLRHVGVDQLAAAFAARDGDGLLEMVAPGVRLDLVSDELVAAAGRAGYSLASFGDGTDARFDSDTDTELGVAVVQHGDHFEFTTISRDTVRTEGRSVSLAAAQRQAIDYLSRGTPADR
jgi:hypothetical protein